MMRFAIIGLVIFPYGFYGESWILIGPISAWMGLLVFSGLAGLLSFLRKLLSVFGLDPSAYKEPEDPVGSKSSEIERK